ncbi:MAG TPA: diguanylate cyclase [Acidimicrobiales bacterium]
MGLDGPDRTRSLRREWSRAFTVMLALLLLAGATTIFGVKDLVDSVRGTANQLQRETVAVAALRSDVVAHEEFGHKFLSGEPANRSAYIAQQQSISRRFDDVATVFPAGTSLRATVVAAHSSWQDGLTHYGLWGTQGPALEGNHAAENPTYGASSDATVALLDGLAGPSLQAMQRGLSHGGELEGILIVVLSGLFGVAVVVTVYFRRRMAKDVLRPVISMYQGVLKLQEGNFAHRIAIARRDELGELTEAFNGMAGALHDNHVALTRRATYDSLTGLPNRASLVERLTASFGSNSDRRARHESVLFLDIDDFKDVNDSLGHEGGDELLVALAARLNLCVRPHDLVARLGGDEFAIVVIEDGAGSFATVIAERILEAMRVPFVVGGAPLQVSLSIGIAQRRRGTAVAGETGQMDEAADLLRRADFAMYMAKGAGKGRFQVFDAKMHDDMIRIASLRGGKGEATVQLQLEYDPAAP